MLREAGFARLSLRSVLILLWKFKIYEFSCGVPCLSTHLQIVHAPNFLFKFGPILISVLVIQIPNCREFDDLWQKLYFLMSWYFFNAKYVLGMCPSPFLWCVTSHNLHFKVFASILAHVRPCNLYMCYIHKCPYLFITKLSCSQWNNS